MIGTVLLRQSIVDDGVLTKGNEMSLGLLFSLIVITFAILDLEG